MTLFAFILGMLLGILLGIIIGHAVMQADAKDMENLALRRRIRTMERHNNGDLG
jgi:predicted small secreted protein